MNFTPPRHASDTGIGCDSGMFESIDARKIPGRIFAWIHANNLIYDQCREDPSLDRQVLGIDSEPRETIR